MDGSCNIGVFSIVSTQFTLYIRINPKWVKVWHVKIKL